MSSFEGPENFKGEGRFGIQDAIPLTSYPVTLGYNIGIMEKNMETIGIIGVLYRDNGKENGNCRDYRGSIGVICCSHTIKSVVQHLT